MKRIIVLGGFGFFGAAAVERLRADGFLQLIASRRAAADLRVDVEDAATIRDSLRAGDVVVDCVGPFQDRTTTLVETAMKVGFDVVDIADSIAYVEKVYALAERIAASGIRVLTACSSISAVSAAMVQLSGIENPTRVTGLLAPASRFAAVPATATSLLRSIGSSIRVLRDGELVTRIGWRESRRLEFPKPIGRAKGFLFESADAFTLPKIWPSLRMVELYVDANVRGLNSLLSLAARWPSLRRCFARRLALGLRVARRFGSASGALAYEIEGARGEVFRCALIGRERGYFTPIAPAVMAARAIVEGRFEHRGLVPPHQQVEPRALLAYLRGIGVTMGEK